MITKYEVDPPNTQLNSDFLARIEAIIQCQHAFSIRRYFKKNGAEVFQNQCTKCGEPGSVIAKSNLTPGQIDRALPFDDALRTAGYEAKSLKRDQETNKQKKHLNQAWWVWYDGYLASSIWKEKRRLVMLRAQGVCEACRSESATEVHHLSYAHVGKEPLFDLVAVCKSCHAGLK